MLDFNSAIFSPKISFFIFLIIIKKHINIHQQ